MDISIVTHYYNGLLKNINILMKHKMYQQNHSASYFKILYDKINEDPDFKNQEISTIIAYDNSIPVGVLIFLHNDYKFESFGDIEYFNVGKIGLYTSPDYRNLGIASCLIKEFESNFISFYSYQSSYPLITVEGKAYDISVGKLNYFIPVKSNLIDTSALKSLFYNDGVIRFRPIKYYFSSNKYNK